METVNFTHPALNRNRTLELDYTVGQWQTVLAKKQESLQLFQLFLNGATRLPVLRGTLDVLRELRISLTDVQWELEHLLTAMGNGHDIRNAAADGMETRLDNFLAIFEALRRDMKALQDYVSQPREQGDTNGKQDYFIPWTVN